MSIETNQKVFIYEVIGLLLLMLVVFPTLLAVAVDPIAVYLYILFSLPESLLACLIYVLLVALSLFEIFLGYIVITEKGLKNASQSLKKILINNATLAPLLYGLLVEILTLTSILRIGQLAIFLVLGAIGFFISMIRIE